MPIYLKENEKYFFKLFSLGLLRAVKLFPCKLCWGLTGLRAAGGTALMVLQHPGMGTGILS